jgi:hypothetical protein
VLVPEMVAYHGSGTSYSGPTVAALPSSGLVNTGTDGGDPSQVFSVFGALTVTGSDFGAPWNGTQAAGVVGRTVTTQGLAGGDRASVRLKRLAYVRLESLTYDRVPIAPSPGTPAAGWMPLDSTAARDAVLADWVPPRSVARRPARQTVVPRPRAIERTSLAWGFLAVK